MRTVVSVLAIETLLLTSAAANEPVVFHRAHFPDLTVVSVSLVGNEAAASVEYDFDVFISLSQTSADGDVAYSDRGKHKASVRCSPPAAVAVRGVDYAIPTSEAGTPDWKDDLWKAVCKPPVS
ncbi:hypothetical protein SJ05684_b59440 (plasmid) [Sinorhizobium sojae CCBAU 05684]|uniref:Uncharacterized protein n=1 Tax=Sinorhizobium sojae CCBAU 05684 TaxID=716928 RepID=A0A249PM83_9HYPH|nr:hypothetical protein [Sinorhizobium sojae]ASY66926.1 hypothetical protein SJ05684_b59440 [Sinorhizobium sojae CCBAU 05684]